MEAQMQISQKLVTGGLYIQTGTGILGPYNTEALREMVKNGILPRSGAVSPDGQSWRRADQVHGLFVSGSVASKEQTDANQGKLLKRAKHFSTSKELKHLLARVCDRIWLHHLTRLPFLVTFFALLSLLVVVVIFPLTGLQDAFSSKRLLLFLALLAPALLAAFGLGSTLINFSLRLALGLSAVEKCFLALHLPKHVFARLNWGDFMFKWLYKGDWLFAKNDESPTSYLHLFRVGQSLATIADEVNVWEKLGKSLPYSMRQLCLPGDTIRQVQDVESLPHWSSTLSEVADGYALGAILDENYADWARSFLARARKRLNLKKKAPVDMLLNYLELEANTKVLAVCVFPKSATADEEVADAGIIAA